MGGGTGGGQLRSRDELFVKSLFGLRVRAFYSSSFSHLVLYESLCELCFYPRSVVRNNPPRKAVAENSGILSHLVIFLHDKYLLRQTVFFVCVCVCVFFFCVCFFATKPLSQQAYLYMFVATKFVFCRDKSMLVETKLLSRQK